MKLIILWRKIEYCQAFTMREMSFARLPRWEDCGSPALEDRRIVSLTGSHNSCLETQQGSDKDASSTPWARESLQCRLPGAEAALRLSAFLSSFCYLPQDFSSPGTAPAHQAAPHFQGASRIPAETWIAWIAPMCYFHFPISPSHPIMFHFLSHSSVSSSDSSLLSAVSLEWEEWRETDSYSALATSHHSRSNEVGKLKN